MKKAIVARGIDSLVIGFKMSGVIPESYTEIWNIAKGLARASWSDGTFPIWIGSGSNSVDVEILASGKQRYEWIMQNDDVQLSIAKEFKEGTAEQFAKGELTPEIIATFRSSFLWRDGLELAVRKVRSMISNLGTITGEKISRVDLCCDLSESLPDLSLTNGSIQGRMRLKSNYVASAKAKGSINTGYQMGKEDLVIRAYNKLHEIKISNKEWFEPIWKKGGWNGESEVTRVECQFRRKILKEFSIETVEELVKTMPDLWNYATKKWMTMREPGKDGHKHRWKISDFWLIVQSCVFMFGKITGLTRYRQIKGRYDHLYRMVKGCTKSMASLLSSAGVPIEEAKLAVMKDCQLIIEDESFNYECQERKVKYSIL